MPIAESDQQRCPGLSPSPIEHCPNPFIIIIIVVVQACKQKIPAPLHCIAAFPGCKKPPSPPPPPHHLHLRLPSAKQRCALTDRRNSLAIPSPFLLSRTHIHTLARRRTLLRLTSRLKSALQNDEDTRGGESVAAAWRKCVAGCAHNLGERERKTVHGWAGCTTGENLG